MTASQQSPRTDSTLGTLTHDPRLDSWHGNTAVPTGTGTIDITIYDSGDLDNDIQRMSHFISWLRDHAQAFLAQVAYESFNMDLIWDEDLSEASVAAQIKLTHAHVLDSVLGVVADPRSFLDDEHLFHVKLDESYKIIDMHQ